MFSETKQLSCQLIDLDLQDYQVAYQRQMKCLQQAIDEDKAFLLLCEHPNVITCGRFSLEENIFLKREDLLQQGIEVISVNRGGDVTLHCPGQLIVYPILPLKHFRKDLHLYLNKLEQVGIDLLKSFDILASRSPRNTGVWVEEQKIISIGIGVKRWIAFHGMGININSDLSLFSLIKPCGLDLTMTSMANILKRKIDIRQVKSKLIEAFIYNFNIQLENL